MSDPWAAAQAGNTASQAGDDSQVIPSQQEGESQLFGGGASAPSLLNKTHGLGTMRTGIITKAPYDRQKVDYNTKKPLFWGQEKPKSVDEGGDPKQPVMDTFLELSTDYVMDAAEAAATGRETPFEGSERVFVAGGHDLKALRKAVMDAGITSGAAMVGKRIYVKRVAQRPNKTGNPSWVLEIKITAA